MGKSSKTKQNSTAEAGPWKYAEGQAKDFVDKLGGLGGIGMTDAQKQAFNQLSAKASQGNPYAGQIGGLAQGAFGAANTVNNMAGRANTAAQGAMTNANRATNAAGQFLNPADRSGTVTDAYKTLQGQLGDYASGKYLDPMSNPQMQAMLQQVGDDVGNRINAQFAGAGRDLSGANQMAYGRGVTAAQLPLLLDQYNKAQANQMNAAAQLYGAGNQTSQTLSGLDQNRASIANTGVGMLGQGTNMLGQGTNMMNQGAGLYQAANNLGKDAVGFGQAALDAQNYGANSILDLEQQMKAMPYEDMSLWASMLFPAAGLGGTEQSKGTAKAKMGLFSDARLKEDIQEVGKLADGQRIYKYAYKDDPTGTTHIGLLAQEAEKKTPEAVGINGPTGFKVVEYDSATRKAAEIVAARRKGK
jgi:hypothetical protein